MNAATMTGDPPFVGRADELDRIVTGLVLGDRSAFVIAGPAGVGKSRLAAEISERVGAKGWDTARLVATRSCASIPFGVFAPMLEDLATESFARLELLQHASQAIINRNQSGLPLLLVVDDAHLLDDGSAALLHQLVQSKACHLVVTVRTPGPRPDPVTTLWKDALADRIDLTPLDESEVSLLAAGALGGVVGGPSVRWLWEATGGNAMFVRELLIGAQESGSLRNRGGVWMLKLPMAVPERLVELISIRLAGLAPATSELVDLLAVGEPLPYSSLERVVGGEALEDAERLDLITIHDGRERDEATLAHPLYAEVRRQEMPRSTFRRLSGTLAASAVQTGGDRDDDVLRIARWQLDAGEAGDPEILTRAATMARLRHDLPLASRLGRAALASGGGLAAGLAVGEAEFFSGNTDAAEAVLVEMLPLCASDAEIAMVASARSYNVGFLMGDRDRAEVILAEALAAITEELPRLRLIVRRGTMRTWSGQLQAGLEDATELLESGDDQLVVRGAAIASACQTMLGRGEAAAATARSARALHRRMGRSGPVEEIQLTGSALANASIGQMATAEEDVQAGYEAGILRGDNEAIATFCLIRGFILVERGYLAEAVQMFREGTAINQEIHDPGPLRWCAAGIVLAEGMSGRPAAAKTAVEYLDALPSHWMTSLDSDLVDRGRAWAMVAAGQHSAARTLLHEAATRSRALDNRVAEMRLLHDLVRLGDAAPTLSRLDELAATIDGPLVRVVAAHAHAVAESSRLGLETAARSLEELGLYLLAAEAASGASVACRTEGLQRQAAMWEHKVEELTARCGEVRTPALANAGAASRLTAREREIVELAASGKAAKEIAEHLVLGLRTVENHLQHAYAKLGISGRSELVAALGGRSFRQ